MRYDLLVLRLESQPEFIPVRGGFDRVMVCNNNAILLKFLTQIVALVVPTVVKKINIISLHLVEKYRRIRINYMCNIFAPKSKNSAAYAQQYLQKLFTKYFAIVNNICSKTNYSASAVVWISHVGCV